MYQGLDCVECGAFVDMERSTDLCASCLSCLERSRDEFDDIHPAGEQREGGDTTEERCHANNDGDCTWDGCPQRANYQVWCPLAVSNDDE